MTPAKPFDVAIIGGGFSGLAVLANLVRLAEKPLSIALISRDALGHFGPAYSTMKPEHLLNVRAGGMGIFAAHPGDFFHWCRDNAVEGIAPAAFVPRMVYARYLQSVLDETLRLATEKNICFRFFQTEAEGVSSQDHYAIVTPDGPISALNIVLAIGNSLKAAAEKPIPGLVTTPWDYDYKQLPPNGHVAIIGGGLTAVDCIISILKTGWDGKISCYSGSGLLPRAHLADFNADKTVKSPPLMDNDMRLSRLFGKVLKIIRNAGVEWQYAIDGLRPQTQALWKSLSLRDKHRLAEKYFTRWNVHRHRFAPEIAEKISAAMARGQLQVIKARCGRPEPDGERISFEIGREKQRNAFDLAFQCTGVNYRFDSNPLLKKLEADKLLQPDETGYGIVVGDDFSGHTNAMGKIYALGAPLFGQLFETTAVPELRFQADAVARELTPAL